MISMWKGFITIAALIWLLPCVCPHFEYKSIIPWESLITMVTLQYFYSLVCCNMSQCPHLYGLFHYVLLKHVYLGWKSCHTCYTDMVSPHCVSTDEMSYYYSVEKPYDINCIDMASLLCEFVNAY